MKKLCIIISLILCINLTACFDSTNKSKETQSSSSNILTIATFEDLHNYYLEEAVKKYNENNPDTKVEIIVYGSSIEGEDKVEKYRSTINTELMSGKAPDIIDLKDIPYKKYIDSGMLVNISELMKEDDSFNINNYNTNIFEALKYKDGLYTIPLGYIIRLITGNCDLKINNDKYSWQNFIDSIIRESNIKEYVFCETDINLFNRIFRSEYKYFVNEEDKTSSFTSKDFINILEYCKKLSNEKIIYKTGEDLDNAASTFQFFGTNSFKFIPLLASDTYAQDNKVRHYYKFPSNNAESSASCSFFNMYAINSNSNNKEMAWKFIKFMLSDEIQASPNLLSFPVNNAGFEKKIESESQEYINDIKETNKISLDKANELLADYTEQFKQIASSMTNCTDIDIEILNIVMEYAEMFFTEQKTAEETAQIIQNKVSIYLNEQL